MEMIAVQRYLLYSLCYDFYEALFCLQKLAPKLQAHPLQQQCQTIFIHVVGVVICNIYGFTFMNLSYIHIFYGYYKASDLAKTLRNKVVIVIFCIDILMIKLLWVLLNCAAEFKLTKHTTREVITKTC